jgi:hypothetical protein
MVAIAVVRRKERDREFVSPLECNYTSIPIT